MAYDLKDMTGSLFKNDRKEKDSHPDYNGTAKIHGRKFWMSAWIKRGAKGKWLSFSFKPKDAQPPQEAKPYPADKQDAPDDMADEIPF